MHVDQPSSSSSASSASGAGSAGGSQIARLQDQLKGLYKDLKDLANEDLSPDEKQRKSELLQARIQLVQQQIAALQKQQQEKAQQQQADAAGTTASKGESSRPGAISGMGGFLDVHA